MIRTSRRPANDDDLRAVKPPGSSFGRNLVKGSLPLAGLVFVAALVVTGSVLIAGVIGGGFFAASLVSNLRFFGNVTRRAGQKGDGNAVEVIEVEASRVFDIEPSGSHGPALVFFSDDGRALLLAGQWLLEQPSFPSTSFHLFRWADTGKPIRIEATGADVTPEHSTVQVRHRLRDIEIFEAKPETLAQDLDRQFGRARASGAGA